MEGREFGLQMSRASRPSAPTLEAVEAVPGVASALPAGIFTSSLPGVFSTTRFMATPSVACRIFPLPAMSGETMKHVKLYNVELRDRSSTLLQSAQILTSCQSTFRAPAATSRRFHHLGFLGWTFLSAGRASTASHGEIKIVWVGSRVANLLEIGDEFHFGTKRFSLRAGGKKTTTTTK